MKVKQLCWLHVISITDLSRGLMSLNGSTCAGGGACGSFKTRRSARTRAARWENTDSLMCGEKAGVSLVHRRLGFISLHIDRNTEECFMQMDQKLQSELLGPPPVKIHFPRCVNNSCSYSCRLYLHWVNRHPTDTRGISVRYLLVCSWRRQIKIIYPLNEMALSVWDFQMLEIFDNFKQNSITWNNYIHRITQQTPLINRVKKIKMVWMHI